MKNKGFMLGLCGITLVELALVVWFIHTGSIAASPADTVSEQQVVPDAAVMSAHLNVEEVSASSDIQVQDYDLNGDGVVNVLDMIMLAQHMGESGPAGWLPEDINHDGKIDILDMVILGQNQTAH